MPNEIEKILNTASSFITASERCWEQRRINERQFQMPLAPAIVCTAFSIELHLKAIIAIETGAAPRGHDLSVLFGRVSENMQNRIRATMGIDEAQFAAALQQCSTAFEDWRYIHELPYASINGDFLRRLAYVLREVAHGMPR